MGRLRVDVTEGMYKPAESDSQSYSSRLKIRGHRVLAYTLGKTTKSQRHNRLIALLIGLGLPLLSSGKCLADYAVQVGSFRSASLASERARFVNTVGFPAIIEKNEGRTGLQLSTVLVGPYKESIEAQGLKDSLFQNGVDGFVRVYRGSGINSLSHPPVELAQSRDTPFAEGNATTHRNGSLFFDSMQLAAAPSSESAQPPTSAKPQALPFGLTLSGHAQTAVAYTVASPDHWSKIKNTLHLAVERALSSDVNLKVSGRFSYDGAYDASNFYPERVRRDQRFDGMFHETYLDMGFNDLSLRLGRQNIVWGEVVGLFFADVVTAKDLREFLVPEFDYIRIPQWAARAEYFKGDFKAEGIWIPYMTYDRIGKPGAEFYPFTLPPPPGFRLNIRNERTPHSLEDSAFGLRASYLINGWDLAAFYYGSMDSNPAFFRSTVVAPSPTIRIRPDHERIHQAGVTMSKDTGSFIFKAEGIYTWDRYFDVTNVSDSNGVVRQNFLDYILSAEIPLPSDARLNLQFFQRFFTNYDSDIVPRRVETGASLFASAKVFDEKVEPELLLVHSLNRLDYMARFKINWYFAKDWRLVAGTAFFGGKNLGLFGRFDNRDRVFTELRYSF
jgi:hypothetical protein